MKKLIIVLLAMVLYATSGLSQRRKNTTEVKWLSIALKGGYGGTVMFNTDVMSDGKVTLNFLSPSYSYGGRFGITYGDHIGINYEPLFSGFGQEYNINDDVQPYAKNQRFTAFDNLLSLRYISNYGFYFEAGPQFSKLKSASVENDKTGNFTDGGEDYLSNFSENYTSLVAGLGFAAHNGDRLQVNIGLRGTYTFGNLVANPNYYVLDDGVYQPAGGPFTSTTNPFTLKLMVEVNYFFGFWGDATCGRGRLMFFQ
ncbi:MAG: hypothetical protein U0W24_17480 [Bacteroidales bacterium]